MSFRNDGTRPGAGDGVSPPLAPSQGCEQETTTAETTGRRHEAGRWGWSLPSSRSQSGMRAGDDDRRDDGATARGLAPEFGSPPPLAPSQGCEWGTTTAETTERRHEAGRWGWSQGCEQGTTMAVPRGYEGDKQIRSILGRADPEQGPP